MNEFLAVVTVEMVHSALLSESELKNVVYQIKQILKTEKVMYHFYGNGGFVAVCNADLAFLLSIKLSLTVLRLKETIESDQLEIQTIIALGYVETPVKNMAKGIKLLLPNSKYPNGTFNMTSKPIRCLTVIIPDDKLHTTGFALSLIYDGVFKKMSTTQAEVVLELLTGAKETEIAQKLHKSQSTINTIKQASNWSDLEQAIKIYSSLVSQKQFEPRDAIKSVIDLPKHLTFEGVIFTLEIITLEDTLTLGYMIFAIMPNSPHYDDDPKNHKMWKRHSLDSPRDYFKLVSNIKTEYDLRWATNDLYNAIYVNNLDPDDPYTEER